VAAPFRQRLRRVDDEKVIHGRIRCAQRQITVKQRAPMLTRCRCDHPRRGSIILDAHRIFGVVRKLISGSQHTVVLGFRRTGDVAGVCQSKRDSRKSLVHNSDSPTLK
jgi:hypothetical protein